MQRIATIQYAFNRGEIDPSLFGRRDIAWLASGAELARNLVVRPQGGVLKRGGTEYVADAMSPDRPSRLIRFQFNAEQTYLLEFGEMPVGGATKNRFRVFMGGGGRDGAGLVANDAGEVLSFESPYSPDEMRKVCVCQTEDRMFFTHPDHPPRTLTRHGHGDWRWEALFLKTLPAPVLDPIAPSGDARTGDEYAVTAVAADGTESLISNIQRSGNPAAAVPAIGYDISTIQGCRAQAAEWRNGGFADAPSIPVDPWAMDISACLAVFLACGYGPPSVGGFLMSLPRPDGSLLAIPFGDVATARNEVANLVNGGRYRGLAEAQEALRAYVAAKTPSGTNVLSWTPVAGASFYRVYRRRDQGNGEKPLLSAAETEAAGFADARNREWLPNSQPAPEKDSLPFADGHFPGVCAYYQQRLILARTNRQPNTVWGSALGEYRNFKMGGVEDGHAWEHTFNADQVNEVLWIVALDDLVIGTAGGEFHMGGGNSVITPKNVMARRQSNYGCAAVPPVVVGRAILGVGHKRRVIRSYSYSLEADGYKSRSISHYAGHLFDGREIREIAYLFEPDSTLWAVMSDGGLVSCAFMQEEEVLGWSGHSTDGAFEACSSMAGADGGDEVWFVVARPSGAGIRRSIERMRRAQTIRDDVRDAFYVDSGMSGKFGEPVDAVHGLDHLAGRAVACLADGNVFDGLEVDADGTVRLPVKASAVAAGLPYKAELLTLDLPPPDGATSNRAATPLSASCHFYHTAECLYGPSPERASGEVNFRLGEEPGRPIRPYTGSLDLFPAAGAAWRGNRLYLCSQSPVPFGILSLAIQTGVGEEVASRGRRPE